MVRCPGVGDTRPHLFDGPPLISTPDGALCIGCARARHERKRAWWVAAAGRERPVVLLEGDGPPRPVERTPAINVIVAALVKASPVESMERVLRAHPDAPLELAIGETGASLFVADVRMSRIATDGEAAA